MGSATQVRSVRIERNGDGQTITIPEEFALQGEEATVRQDAKGRLIVETQQPGNLSSLIALLHTWEPLGEEDSISVIEDQLAEPFDL